MLFVKNFYDNSKGELKVIFREVPNPEQVSLVLNIVYTVNILNIILQGVLFNPLYRSPDER